ncbi:MAG TPA: PEPxxWA-CTERM sorting domain-containing protein [Caulobacteraceae bacterium]|nr:PEPxxWA-CTERM sorting domain-containing protein [Caulobacteraceae bacterium]
MTLFAKVGATSVAAGLALMGLATSAHATTVTYPDFSSTTGLTLVGSAGTTVTGDGAVLRLTPATTGQSGAAYSTTPITLGPSDTFSTTFQFRFTNTGGIDPADGITFVLAANPTGLGVGGGGLGYLGVPNSVAIEFDTFNNGGADPNSNHVGVDLGGALTDINATAPYGVGNCVTGTNISPGCMSNGDLWSVTASYNGTSLTVVVQDGAMAPQTVISSLPIDIAADLGTNTAFVGFTGGTGSGFENQDIKDWSFANNTSLAGVPEPATWTLLGVGFGVMGFALRRRQRRVAAA